MVMRLIDKSDGVIMFDGEDIGEIPAKKFRCCPRQRIQMVFQDPTDSLNPRFTAARAIADPILRLGVDCRREAVRARRASWPARIGLPLDLLDPPSASSLWRQKARASASPARSRSTPTSSSSTSRRRRSTSRCRRSLNLLQELKESLGMSYLFVSHDLNVVRLLCDRVIVMQAGKIVEQGPTERVLFAPEAQYTRDLLAAIPHPRLGRPRSVAGAQSKKSMKPLWQSRLTPSHAQSRDEVQSQRTAQNSAREDHKARGREGHSRASARRL